MPKNSHLIFVSHSSQDTWVAKQIARGLREAGADVFLDDTEIDLGEDFEDEILTSLGVANELLVLLTPWGLERPYVWTEFGVAWFRRIPIVALLHGITPEELQGRPEVPALLKRRNLIELNGIERYFAQVRQRVDGQARVRRDLR